MRVGGVNKFSQTQDSARGQSADKERHLGTEFDSDVALVDSGHSEVGEALLAVVVEAHHVGLVHYLGVVGGCPEVVSAGGELVAEVAGNGLAVAKAVNEAVAGAGRDECLIEGRGVAEIAETCAEAVAAGEGVGCEELGGACEEVADL